MKTDEYIVIYDNDYRGHHQEFLSFLMETAFEKKGKWDNRYLFVIHEKARSVTEKFYKHFEYYFLSDDEINPQETENVFKRSIKEWKLIQEIIGDRKVGHLILMNLDPYQYVIGRSQTIESDVKISGILFHSYLRIDLNAYEGIKKIKPLIKKWRKALQIKWMFRNKNLQNVFLLNDKETVFKLNKNQVNQFKYLPDPVPPFTPSKEFDFVEKQQEKDKRRMFLAFGFINKRKNIVNIIKSLECVNKEYHSQILLKVCGKCESPELHEEIKENAKRIIEKYPEIRIQIKIEYLSDSEVFCLFSEASAILIPYIDFFASSGVVGHAAKFSKPVIASKYGVIGAVVKTYDLGFAINPNDEKDIAQAIEQVVINGDLRTDGTKYLADHTCSLFGEKILSSVLN